MTHTFPVQLREEYFHRGFAVLKNLLTPEEIAQLAEQSLEPLQKPDIIDERNLRCRFQTHKVSGETLLDALDPIIDLVPAAAVVAQHPKLLALLEHIFGEPYVLFKDKLIYRPPGVIGYALHQDYISWRSFPKSFVTVMVAIDASLAENGGLYVYEGAQKLGYLSRHDGDYHDLPESCFAAEQRREVSLQPGDAVIFGCMLPHGSRTNHSTQWRRHLYLSYQAASEQGSDRETHYGEFHGWLRQRYSEYGFVNVFFK